MEPVTHVLTGACLARAGFHRRIAYATAAMAVAAEFPDIDTLWRLRGPVAAFAHHRGITHSFVGLPVEAALLLSGFYLFHRWRQARQPAVRGTHTRAPVRWLPLYGCLLLALLSHLLLDYTNDYGIRPFLPFDSHWYAASIVFIFDPALFLLLLAGLLLPSLAGLIGQEITGRKERFAGPAWARAALLAVVGYWGLRWFEHGNAVALAAAQSLRAPEVVAADVPTSDDSALAVSVPQASGGEDAPAPTVSRPLLPALRTLASPDPLSPFTWYTASDFGPALRLGTVHTAAGTITPGRILNKPPDSPMLRRARATSLGRAYLDWSALPWLSVTSPGRGDSAEPLPLGATVVFMEDTRFMGTSPLLQRGTLPPLTGEVIVDRTGKVLAEGIDGSFESRPSPLVQ